MARKKKTSPANSNALAESAAESDTEGLSLDEEWEAAKPKQVDVEVEAEIKTVPPPKPKHAPRIKGLETMVKGETISFKAWYINLCSRDRRFRYEFADSVFRFFKGRGLSETESANVYEKHLKAYFGEG